MNLYCQEKRDDGQGCGSEGKEEERGSQKREDTKMKNKNFRVERKSRGGLIRKTKNGRGGQMPKYSRSCPTPCSLDQKATSFLSKLSYPQR